jgi:DNA uptake protein ComE-like DNA-binding protein
MRITVVLPAVVLAFTASTTAAQVGKHASLLEPNTATEQQLAAVPGLNATLAKSIVDRRPFASMLALDSLLGQTLSREQRTEVYKRVFLHLNLNTATSAEILLVPGTGSKHAHEFEEYRPYRALAVWRREMGKYWDAAEVARLEGYVFVPLDLNAASDADIMTIPGMTPRMLHEFKEYRPYDAVARYRREMAKYVDAKEVDRLARYVTLPQR